MQDGRPVRREARLEPRIGHTDRKILNQIAAAKMKIWKSKTGSPQKPDKVALARNLEMHAPNARVPFKQALNRVTKNSSCTATSGLWWMLSQLKNAMLQQLSHGATGRELCSIPALLLVLHNPWRMHGVIEHVQPSLR